MKICLLSNPRSGSKSLMALLQSVFWGHKYYTISEPFNKDHHEAMGSDSHDFFIRIIKNKNVIIKTLINQKPEQFESLSDWYENLFVIFDKVILLDRRDKKAQTESYLFWKLRGEFGRWHVPCVYDLKNIDQSKYNEMFEFLKTQSNLIENLKIRYKVPLFYYEDIFIQNNFKIIDDIFAYIEMDRDEYNINKYIISNEFKVRQEKYNKTLI